MVVVWYSENDDSVSSGTTVMKKVDVCMVNDKDSFSISTVFVSAAQIGNDINGISAVNMVSVIATAMMWHSKNENMGIAETVAEATSAS